VSRFQVRSRRAKTVAAAAVVSVLAAVAAPLAVTNAGAATTPDPFFTYSGSTPLASVPNGTVLDSRKLQLHIVGIATPITAIQLVYRTTNQLGAPAANVTSVLLPPIKQAKPKVLAYQSFYDSLNPEDSPSRAVAGAAVSLGGVIDQLESTIMVPALLAGFTVSVADTEGQNADFADGPEYGMNTLDALTAATNAVASTGVTPTAPIGLIGYSGGAIATDWAAELAATYAPAIGKRIVGSAMGGVLVDPAHNLHYISGSLLWAGVAPMAIIGAARSFGIDMTPYLNDKGERAYAALQKAPITAVLGEYPGLTWAQITKPQYNIPESVGPYVNAVNHLIMGTGGTPTAPMFIGQGAAGWEEGTPPGGANIGAGDGVMIAGDVRTLASEYCSRGVKVTYQQYDWLSHSTSTLPWAAAALPWLRDRFNGVPATQNCSSIAPGNSLAPVVQVAPAG
jgi:hypothetical protein